MSVIDISLAKKAEEALQQSRAELAKVPARLLAAQEEDRRRLAGELHDSIGQTLVALKFRIEHVVQIMQAGSSEQVLELLEQFIPTLQYAIDETRIIYMGLRPKLLDDFGVIAAVYWYCQELMKLYPGLHIEPEIRTEEADIPEHLKIAIFRLCQEAINNVAKHARAEWADLVLTSHDQTIELSITDDGIGCDPDNICQAGFTGAYGLTGMRERVENTGGTLTVESSPGRGTTVKAVWAVNEI